MRTQTWKYLALAGILLTTVKSTESVASDREQKYSASARKNDRCFTFANDYLMQYVDRDNLLDVQSIVYDYSKINPCIFNNASSGCCTVIRSLYGPKSGLHGCTCDKDFVNTITFKGILPIPMVNAYIQRLKACDIQMPDSCDPFISGVRVVPEDLSSPFSSTLKELLSESHKNLNKLAYNFNRNVEVNGIPFIQFLSQAVDSLSIQGMTLGQYFSVKHLSQLYRSITIFDFPLHRIIDLVVYQITGFPELSLQENIEYVQEFMIGALGARLEPSDIKEDVLHLLETLEVTVNETKTVVAYLDLQRLLQMLDREVLSLVMNPAANCTCKITLLEISESEKRDNTDRRNSLISFPIANHQIHLDILKSFNRSWNELNKLDAVQTFTSSGSETEASEANVPLNGKLHETILHIVRAALADVIFAIGASGSSRGLLDLNLSRDICIKLQGWEMCPGSFLA